jgi:DNA repair protein RadC
MTTSLLREMTVKYAPAQDAGGQPIIIGTKATEPGQVAAALRAILKDETIEVFAVVLLSARHQIIGYHEVTRGTVDRSLVHPRDVFKIALLANASGIVLAHNHPSGDPTPSTDDRALTRRLCDAGTLLGIDVLDHIIIGEPGYASFRDMGILAI